MTDVGVTAEFQHDHEWSIPSRLGTTAVQRAGRIEGTLTSLPSTENHGALRATAVVFLVDAVAGLTLDTEPEVWTFTSDLSVRMPRGAAPPTIRCFADILRSGKRSASCAVLLSTDADPAWGLGLATFARVARRAGDPEKPQIDLDHLAELWAQVPPLEVPVREAAGITVIDASSGVVELTLRPDLANPAGALQGAMVALVAEAAAEELSSSALGSPQVVTDLDIRYLTQARNGPVRSRTRFIGAPEAGSVVIDLVDMGLNEKLLAAVTARTAPAP